MRYAIVSDIHANLPAWTAVLADIKDAGVDRIICLGDTVGYGPQPRETQQSVVEAADYLVLGNHDAVVGDIIAPSRFNSSARDVIEWTREQFTEDERAFFADLELAIQFKAGDLSFLCVHSAANVPDTFPYILDENRARASWAATKAQVTFVGHTHLQRVDRLDDRGQYQRLRPATMPIERGMRYIINTGSVGFPRSSDTRACYYILDTAESVAHPRQVPFDLGALRKAVIDCPVHSEQANRLLQRDLEKQGKSITGLSHMPILETEMDGTFQYTEMQDSDDGDPEALISFTPLEETKLHKVVATPAEEARPPAYPKTKSPTPRSDKHPGRRTKATAKRHGAKTQGQPNLIPWIAAGVVIVSGLSYLLGLHQRDEPPAPPVLPPPGQPGTAPISQPLTLGESEEPEKPVAPTPRNSSTARTEPATQRPYNGTPVKIPGAIMANQFDRGGEGVAYHDKSEENELPGAYRNDEGVDVGRNAVGHIQKGEWLEYTVDVARNGVYDLEIKAASQGQRGSLQVAFNGVVKAGPVVIPKRGSREKRAKVMVSAKRIQLKGGQQVMRVSFSTGGFRLLTLSFRPSKASR